jgi:hypothetical protein
MLTEETRTAQAAMPFRIKCMRKNHKNPGGTTSNGRVRTEKVAASPTRYLLPAICYLLTRWPQYSGFSPAGRVFHRR